MGKAKGGDMAEGLMRKLQAISFSAKEAGEIEIRNEDIKASEEECNMSLFGKVVGDRRAGILGIKRTMGFIWKLQTSMEVKEVSSNFFQFIFNSLEDKKKVAAGHNWLYENQYIVLKEWFPGLNSKHKCFEEINIWVQVSNVPLNWMSIDVGLKIGQIFNAVKNVVICKAGGEVGSFIKLLVAMNLNEPIPRCTSVKLGDQKVLVAFRYERLANLCYYCGMIGHLDRGCEKKIKDIENRTVVEGQFGEWLKASETLPGGRSTYSGTSERNETPPKHNSNQGSWEPVTVNPALVQSEEARIGGSSSKQQQVGEHQHLHHPEEHEILNLAIVCREKEKKDLQETHYIEAITMETDVVEELGSSWKRRTSADGRLLRVEEVQMEVVNTVGSKRNGDLITYEGNSDPIEEALKESNKKINHGKMKVEKASLEWPQVFQIKDSRRIHHPEVIFLSETKKSRAFTKTVCSKLGFKGRWYLEDPVGTRGGLLVMWDSEVEVKVVVGNEFCIQMELRGKGMVEWCWMIFVYMSTDKNTRSRQWEYLESCKSQWGPCWVIAGDWNDISSNHEKRGGIPRIAASFIPFNQFIFRMEMCEVDQKGSFFTWGNNRSSGDYIEERLDKVFVSFEWMAIFPNMEVSNFFRTASDHNDILFDTEKDAFKHHRRFQFNSHWLKLQGIQEAVEAGWQGIVEGTAMYQVHQKVKNTRMALLAWHKPIHRNSATTIKELTTKMEDMRMEGPDRNWREWGAMKAELDSAHQEEENYWRLKSRALWLKSGDRNTRYFHAHTAQRRKRNIISKLKTSSGQISDNQHSMAAHITGFYSNLFTSDGSRGGAELLQQIPCSISDAMNNDLIKPVEEEEVKAALFAMASEKAPGDDGMSAVFFQHFWHILKIDICRAIKSFFITGHLLENWKHTIITLIPKCLYPENLTNYRPISLCGVLYKIVAKMLAERLKPCLDSCISQSQTAFVPGRHLIDNVVIAHEVFHFLHRHRSGSNVFMAVKLDMEKAYDRVEWESIKKTMLKMGFHVKFVQWIYSCIANPTFSFNLNGSVCGFVTSSRGIRQGDPLSPYLFILVSELLSCYLHNKINVGQFRGVRISQNGPMLSHLLFADDALVFCKADEEHSILLLDILKKYQEFTVQKVNLHKSSMFLSKNCSDGLKHRIYSLLEGVVVKRSSRYLGLPLGIGASKIETFQFVVEAVRDRIGSWKNNFLSSAGREILIKAVLNALPVFVMSCFLLPVNVCKEVCRLLAKFWWDKGNNQSRSMHWLAWDKMTLPKGEGGLGFQNIKLFNRALILKQLWRIFEQPELLMSKVLKCKYFPNCSMFDCQKNGGASWLWKSWTTLLPVLKIQVNIIIRNGANTSISECFWVLGLNGSAPKLTANINGSTFWVKDLLIAGGVQWDPILIRAIFSEVDASLIMQIKSLNPRKADQWNCSFLGKGKFSVKKAYSWLLDTEPGLRNEAECSRLASGNKRARQRCWSLKVMGKVKHFIWKCFTNILPVSTNLEKRGMEVDTVCRICGEGKETQEHVLFLCRRAKLIWDLAPVKWNRVQQDNMSFKEWWWWICTMNFKDISEERIQLSTYILWWLWRARNLWVFERQWQHERWILEATMRDWQDYNAAG
ncbi:RNA-directed DNA polymerase-like protein [Striga asiatica]|uniref:RNA-directed DNA polymerase-like protein n=1 Tax=Striga asiatica TaxID=4170 RepID=A0A5A7PEH8_STRAF|nr:RNA-directed DNA polymerase-like protein [Striga asiatica]